jgi:hypothetical protein
MARVRRASSAKSMAPSAAAAAVASGVCVAHRSNAVNSAAGPTWTSLVADKWEVLIPDPFVAVGGNRKWAGGNGSG